MNGRLHSIDDLHDLLLIRKDNLGSAYSTGSLAPLKDGVLIVQQSG